MESKYLSAETLAQDVAKYIANEIQKVLTYKNYCTLGLSGGKSPTLLYQNLAKLLPSSSIRQLIIFLVDERHTDFSSPDSNYKLIKDHFLFHLTVSPKRFIHPLTFLSIDEASDQYRNDLEELTPFDILLLGIGEDGHTASLFPGEEYLGKDGRLIVCTPHAHNNYKRISLSYKAILDTKKVIFYVPGKNKEDILTKVCQKGDNYPAQRILLCHTHTTLFREKT